VITPAGQPLLIVAHRGSSGLAPENTMAAFRLAVAAGADMIEFDVRMTRDYALVVHHDRRLGRTSNGSGRVRDRMLREISSCDAGGWFSPRFRGEKVPTLAEVLHGIPDRIGLNIEIKTDGDRRRGSTREESVAGALREARRTAPVIVSSFDHRFLRRLHSLDASIVTGALYLPVRDRFRRASAIAKRVGASWFVCSRAQLRGRHVRDAHEQGIAIAVYGIDTTAELRRVRGKGVDAVITNYPDRIIRAVRST